MGTDRVCVGIDRIWMGTDRACILRKHMNLGSVEAQ